MMTLNDLLHMTTDRIRRAVRNWLIERRIAAEYRYLDFFRWQVQNGNKGIADSSKRIVNLENAKGL